MGLKQSALYLWWKWFCVINLKSLLFIMWREARFTSSFQWKDHCLIPPTLVQDRRRGWARETERESCHCVMFCKATLSALLCNFVPYMSICGPHLCVFSAVSVWQCEIMHLWRYFHDNKAHFPPKPCQDTIVFLFCFF